ncbi:MAG: signal peptidase II [Actinobacteria bacterium]|nr:signal peptidase II [Actinomycetota bacterium]
MKKRRIFIGVAKAFALFIPLVVFWVAMDQVTKVFARRYLEVGQQVTAIPHVIDLTLVFNKGAAFGMMEGSTLYFVISALVITIAVVLYLALTKQHSIIEVVTLALVIGGAIGNAIDRLVFDGSVTDFIAFSFIDFPVFNVADIGVTCGCALFIIAFVFLYRVTEEDNTEKSING